MNLFNFVFAKPDNDLKTLSKTMIGQSNQTFVDSCSNDKQIFIFRGVE